MKRDMDLVRDLLLRIESDPRLDGTTYGTYPEDFSITSHSLEAVRYHLRMLIEEDFLKGSSRPTSDNRYRPNMEGPRIFGRHP